MLFISHLSRWVLASVLVAAAIGKWTAGPGGQDATAAWIHLSVVLVEAVLAAGLMGTGAVRHISLSGVLILAVGAMVWRVIAGSDVPCGCFGNLVHLEYWEHLMLSSTMGLLALLVLRGDSSGRPT